MKRRNSLVLFLILFLLPAISTAAISASQNKLIKELDRTELEVGQLQEKVENFTGSIRSASSAIGGLEADLMFKNGSMLSRKQLIQERIRGISLYSIPQKMEFLVAADSVDSINRGEAIVSYMLKKDVAEYNLISQDIQRLNDLKDIIGKERSKLEANKKKISEYLDELKKTMKKKLSLLAKMQSTERGYKALVSRSQKNSEKISKIVGTVKNNPAFSGSVVSEALKGLIKPVQGTIVGHFGKLWDTKIRNWVYNKGVSVRADYGAEVKAASSGNVSFFGWVPSYGRVLIIKHSDDMFSVYGHLGKTLLSQGDKVTKGAVIAYVGDTGSVDKPTLYFEVSKARNNIDPTTLFD